MGLSPAKSTWHSSAQLRLAGIDPQAVERLAAVGLKDTRQLFARLFYEAGTDTPGKAGHEPAGGTRGSDPGDQ
jgi:hypothetical protein